MRHNAVKDFLLSEYFLVFLLCLAVIQGPAFTLMGSIDQLTIPDCRTYLGIAQLQFHQSPVRRYRIIIPMVARAINWSFHPFFNKMTPITFPGDFSLSFSFLIVNNLLMSFFGVLIYRYCKTFTRNVLALIIGLLVMLTCRWTAYWAGLALTDSLYCVVITLMLLGIRQKNSSMLLWAIFLGPFAKESFILFIPIFFFSHIPKLRLLVYFILSGLLVAAYHYGYDSVLGINRAQATAADLDHFNYLFKNIRSLFSFHGMYDILSSFGWWLLVPLTAFVTVKGFGAYLRSSLGGYIYVFLLAILVHIIMSGDMARMFYFAMPVICAITALATTELKKKFIGKIILFDAKK